MAFNNHTLVRKSGEVMRTLLMIALILLLLAAAVMLIGGGGHTIPRAH